MEIVVAVRNLRIGDYVVPADAIIKDVQPIGPLVIIDFTVGRNTLRGVRVSLKLS